MIYLTGPHGFRQATNESEALEHEKDGYKRIDINQYMADKQAALNPPKKKAAKKKAK